MAALTVTIRTTEGERTIRASVLMNCSPVLEGFLIDGDTKTDPIVLDMTDLCAEGVDAFLRLASVASHDRTRAQVLSVDEQVLLTAAAIPLVHKYDAKGIMMSLKAAVNAKPDPEAVFEIATHAIDDDGINWMESNTKAVLLEYISKADPYARFNRITKDMLRERVAQMPPKALQELFLWAMGDAVYKFSDERVNGLSHTIVKDYA
jgi:hypothetical protein